MKCFGYNFAGEQVSDPIDNRGLKNEQSLVIPCALCGSTQVWLDSGRFPPQHRLPGRSRFIQA